MILPIKIRIFKSTYDALRFNFTTFSLCNGGMMPVAVRKRFHVLSLVTIQMLHMLLR